MKPALEEFLYPAMEDFRVDVRIAEGTARADDPDGARALHAGRRDDALRPPDAAHARPLRSGGAARVSIRRTSCSRSSFARRRILQVPIDDAGASEIARRSRGTPRVANRLLRRVRDYAQVKADGRVTVAVAGAALRPAQRGRVRPGRHGRADSHHHHREVRRRTGRARHGGGGGGRGCRHAAGRLRAVSSFNRASSSARHAAAAPPRSRTAVSASPRRPPRRPRSLTAESLRTADFDYQLPPELIAQEPLPERSASRLLMVLRADRRAMGPDRRAAERAVRPAGRRTVDSFRQPAMVPGDTRSVQGGVLVDSWFSQLSSLVPAGDLLVLNTTRVRHARLLGTRAVGRAGRGAADSPGGGRQLDRPGQAGSALQPGKRVALGDTRRHRDGRGAARRQSPGALRRRHGGGSDRAVRPAAAAALHHSRPRPRPTRAVPDGLRPTRGERRRADGGPPLHDGAARRTLGQGVVVSRTGPAGGTGHLQAGGGGGPAPPPDAPGAIRDLARGWPG